MSNEIIYTLKKYKERYKELLSLFESEYEDNDEIDFCKEQKIIYEAYVENVSLISFIDPGTLQDNYKPLSIMKGHNIVDEIQEKININDVFGRWRSCDVQLCDKMRMSFTKTISFLDQRKQELEKEHTSENTLHWSGTPTEFIELTKALILNGSIAGTGNQEYKINQLANVLNFKINNPYKLLNDIKTTRNSGSETLFLDKLKKTLLDYITVEKKK